MQRWVDFFVNNIYILEMISRGNVKEQHELKKIAKFLDWYSKSEDVQLFCKSRGLLAAFLRLDELKNVPLVEVHVREILDGIIKVINSIETEYNELFKPVPTNRVIMVEAEPVDGGDLIEFEPVSHKPTHGTDN